MLCKWISRCFQKGTGTNIAAIFISKRQHAYSIAVEISNVCFSTLEIEILWTFTITLLDNPVEITCNSLDVSCSKWSVERAHEIWLYFAEHSVGFIHTRAPTECMHKFSAYPECMHLYIYIYIYIYICVCVCVYIYTYIYIYTHTQTHTWTPILCFTPLCFNAPCQFTPLLNLHLVFSV